MFAPQHSALVRFHCAVREGNLLLQHDTSLTMHVETQLPALHTSTIFQGVQLKELTHRVHLGCSAKGTHSECTSGYSAKGTHSQNALQGVQLKELTHRVHFITQGMCLSADCLLFSRHHWSSLTNDTAAPSTALSLLNKPLYI
jgi:hypothetical protein